MGHLWIEEEEGGRSAVCGAWGKTGLRRRSENDTRQERGVYEWPARECRPVRDTAWTLRILLLQCAAVRLTDSSRYEWDERAVPEARVNNRHTAPPSFSTEAGEIAPIVFFFNNSPGIIFLCESMEQWLFRGWELRLNELLGTEFRTFQFTLKTSFSFSESSYMNFRVRLGMVGFVYWALFFHFFAFSIYNIISSNCVFLYLSAYITPPSRYYVYELTKLL